MDLDIFLTIFEENFRFFQENYLAISEKFQTWVSNVVFNPAKHVHAKFQLSSLYSDGLRRFFYLFFKKNSRFS
jgi:hypothetical protein